MRWIAACVLACFGSAGCSGSAVDSEARGGETGAESAAAAGSPILAHGQGAAGAGGENAHPEAEAGADTGARQDGVGLNKYPCLQPQTSAPGIVQCTGFTHRVEETSATCNSEVPRPERFVNPWGLVAQCFHDADCVAKPYGWCGAGGSGPSVCKYGCVTAEDCGPHGICECGGPVGQCVPAHCTTDSECSDGFLCRSYDYEVGCNVTAFACQSPADSCGSDTDCGARGSDAECHFDEQDRRFECAGPAIDACFYL